MPTTAATVCAVTTNVPAIWLVEHAVEKKKYEEDPNCDCDTVTCAGGEKCDPFSCLCFEEDMIAPCVAVIDEDSSFPYYCTPPVGATSCFQADLWDHFRQEYPYRPFCLLIPNPQTSMALPANFLSDPNVIIKHDISRDGVVEEDWASYCGLDGYTSNNVDFIGLFVDNSGSMHTSTVQASYDKFIIDMNQANIEVVTVENPHENWILPFLTTLQPAE